MNLRWRTGLMWLLLLALPLQGLAAVTMQHCAPGHHAAAAQQPAGLAASAHHHDASAPHHDAGTPAGDAHDAHAGPGAAADVPGSPYGSAAKAKCSACASCCFGAALPAASITLPEGVPATAPIAVPCDEAIGFVTDGPDRPPRQPLA